LATPRSRLLNRAEKAERIAAILDELYPQPGIPLRHEDPFTLLVAVMLSAQTTDAQVNKVTPELFRYASTPARMAALPLETIHSLIRSCGLAPAKAKNLKATSEALVSEFGGRVPDQIEELEKLPGVGHKTASVVMTQAFGRPAFPVDTHIHRLAWRWGLSTGRSVVQTERDLKRLFPESQWGKVHLQMIYFGREYCPAMRHDFEGCPICSWAASRRVRLSSASAAARSARGRSSPSPRRPRAGR
jgi:endonuclease-3